MSQFKYIGEYTNQYVNLNHMGLLPSLSKFMNFGRSTKSNKKNQSSTSKEEKKEEVKDKNNFKYFWKFMADSETYLIPIDHDEFEKGCMHKDFVFDIINGRQK